MCYARPGPRCAGHLSTAMQTTRTQLDANVSAFAAGDPAPHPGVTATALLRLQEEFDGTMTGQRDLSAQIEATVDTGLRAVLQARKDNTAALYAEKKAALESVEGQWGVVNVSRGSRTPWGEAQSVENPAAGIVVAGCAGHGGIKLSPQRNAVIPAPLRNKSGWYEEDAESSIVGMYHPEAFPHYMDGDYEQIKAACEKSVKSEKPDQYTQATGKTVDVSESHTLRNRGKIADKAAFRAEHANEFVTLGNGDTSSQQPWIPKGYAVAPARIDATGEERSFLVPFDQVIEDDTWGKEVVVDPNRALDVTEVMKVGKAPEREPLPPVQGKDLTIDYSTLNGRSAEAAAKELDHRFRWQDGSVSTFGERLATVGVRSKTQTSVGCRIELASGGSYTVKKATFDALTSVPDTTTELDRARAARSRARDAMDRVPMYDREKKSKAEARYLSVAEKAKEVEARDKAENPLRYYDGIQEARTAAFAALLSEKGLSFED